MRSGEAELPHHRDELLAGLPQATRHTLAAESSPPTWAVGGLDSDVVYANGPTAGYVSQNQAIPRFATSANASPATYTSAAAVLSQ